LLKADLHNLANFLKLNSFVIIPIVNYIFKFDFY